jgi:hypothetical protein
MPRRTLIIDSSSFADEFQGPPFAPPTPPSRSRSPSPVRVGQSSLQEPLLAGPQPPRVVAVQPQLRDDNCHCVRPRCVEWHPCRPCGEPLAFLGGIGGLGLAAACGVTSVVGGVAMVIGGMAAPLVLPSVVATAFSCVHCGGRQ